MTYELIDSGDGLKLEKFGSVTLIRPDSRCVWARKYPEAWQHAHATCYKREDGAWQWESHKKLPSPWLFTFSHNNVAFTTTLRLSETKNIGVFPEQSDNWRWMIDCIKNAPTKPEILNLFGYTGAATLCAAGAGARVCHVDASQAAVTWARKNQEVSDLLQAPIRWIVDDCVTFVRREIKRGVRYDGIIFDPPAFGRDTKGKIFSFQKNIYDLLVLCKEVLKKEPLFVIFNGYSMGYSATVLYNLLQDFFPDFSIEYGELILPHAKDSRLLTCSIYARFKKK